VEIGLSRFAGVTLQQIHALRRSPLWPKMVALAPTWTREVEAIDSLGPSLSRYQEFQTPTLLLSGTLSTKYPLRDSVMALSTTLKNSRVSRLEGQGHSAHSIAPALIAERVSAFLLND
jgi:pimeloyl-ACP methyl ester carboxylesterase